MLRTASLPLSAAAPSLPGSHLAVAAATVSSAAQSPHAQACLTDSWSVLNDGAASSGPSSRSRRLRFGRLSQSILRDWCLAGFVHGHPHAWVLGEAIRHQALIDACTGPGTTRAVAWSDAARDARPPRAAHYLRAQQRHQPVRALAHSGFRRQQKDDMHETCSPSSCLLRHLHRASYFRGIMIRRSFVVACVALNDLQLLLQHTIWVSRRRACHQCSMRGDRAF